MEDYKNIQNKDENDLKQRVIITEEELLYLNKQDLIQKWKLQDEYINILEEKSKQTNLEYEKKIKVFGGSKNLESNPRNSKSNFNNKVKANIF